MYINGAYGHDLLPVPFGELANEHGDKGFELGHLLLVIVLHGILVAFLQPGECDAHLCRPPDLSAGQRYLWHQGLLSQAVTGARFQATHSGHSKSSGCYCVGDRPLPSLFPDH